MKNDRPFEDIDEWILDEWSKGIIQTDEAIRLWCKAKHIDLLDHKSFIKLAVSKGFHK